VGPIDPTIQWVSGNVFVVVKRHWREANHLLASSAKVKNGGAIPPLPVRLLA
jgi:hypothetical protein